MVENFTFSDVFGNKGGDYAAGYSTLFSEDPLFCDLENGDLSVCADSPCLPAFNSWGYLLGYASEGCGECASPVERSSLGGVKALYR